MDKKRKADRLALSVWLWWIPFDSTKSNFRLDGAIHPEQSAMNTVEIGKDFLAKTSNSLPHNAL